MTGTASKELVANPTISAAMERLGRFEADHARRITDEVRKLASRVEREAFSPQLAASAKIETIDGKPRRAVDAIFEIPLLRINRVGDLLSRNWVIFPNGALNTCDSFLLSPDYLDISTLAHPRSKDVISDQGRIIEAVSALPRIR
jgi:hypothetical protein